MERLVSLASNPQKVEGDIYWARVISFDSLTVPTIKLGGSQAFNITGFAGYVAPQVPLTPAQLQLQLKGPPEPVASAVRHFLGTDVLRPQPGKAFPDVRPWSRIELTGTATIEYSLNPYEPYPGPVIAGNIIQVSTKQAAVIYDQTGLVGAALDSGTIDVSFLTNLLVYIQWSTGNSQINVYQVDDTGVTLGSSVGGLLGPFTPVSGQTWFGMGPGSGPAAGQYLTPVAMQLPKKIRITIAGGLNQIPRLLIIGR